MARRAGDGDRDSALIVAPALQVVCPSRDRHRKHRRRQASMSSTISPERATRPVLALRPTRADPVVVKYAKAAPPPPRVIPAARPMATTFLFMKRFISSVYAPWVELTANLGAGFATRSPQARRPNSACGSTRRPRNREPAVLGYCEGATSLPLGAARRGGGAPPAKTRNTSDALDAENRCRSLLLRRVEARISARESRNT